MAEKEGFEPSRQLSHPTPLAGEPLRPLGYFSISRFWRRERDSNPRCLAASLVFKTSALNHSAISPQKTSGTIIAKSMRHVNDFLKIFHIEMEGNRALGRGTSPRRKRHRLGHRGSQPVQILSTRPLQGAWLCCTNLGCGKREFGTEEGHQIPFLWYSLLA